MSLRRSGINPLAYCGVEATQPPQFEMHGRAPTVNDYINFNVGTIWLDISGLSASPKVLPTNEQIFVLVSKVSRTATWVHMGGGASTFTKLTGDAGGIIGPDAVNNNINIISGITGLSVDGNPLTNTLIITSTTGALFQTLTGDAGGAIEPDGVGDIDLLGTHGINTLGALASNKITTAIDNAIVLGDLAALGAGIDALNCTTGDINVAAGNIKIPDTNAALTEGVIKHGGKRFIHKFGVQNLFIGEEAGNGTLTGNGNIAIGRLNLQTLTSGTANTAIGEANMRFLTSGESNSSVGNRSLFLAETGNSNSAFGESALDDLVSGSYNSCFGASAAERCTGSNNLAFGYQALLNIVNANYNIGIGLAAGENYVGTESNNIVIQNAGVAAESHITRIGTHGAGNKQQNKCFIAGIRGITTSVADAVAVLIDSSHQLGTASSSIRYKENVKDMADESSIVMKLRPVTFNFKKHPDVPAWGLIAEEVAETFPQLAVYNEDGSAETVKYHEIAVLLLNELQKMSKRLAVLEKKLKG